MAKQARSLRRARIETARHAPRQYRLPAHAAGMRVGLFGGTFDPAHEAHVSACLLAMKRLRLDQVWWLVTPGNPLKDTRGLAALDDRITAARALARHPRIVVSGIEAGIGVRYTYDTISYLVGHCRGVRFVWLMGADNLRSFHRWQRWRDIARLIPIAVIDRVGPSLYAAGGTAAQALAGARIPESAAVTLPARKAPVWVFLHGLKSPLSSTALRTERRSHARRGAGRKKAGKGRKRSRAAGTAVRPGRLSKLARKLPRAKAAAGRRKDGPPANGKASRTSKARTSVRARSKAGSKTGLKAGSQALGAKAGLKTGSKAGLKTLATGGKRVRGQRSGTTTKKPRRAKTARRGRRKA